MATLAQLLRTGPVVEHAAEAEASRQRGDAKGRNARAAQETLQKLHEGGYRRGDGGWVDLRGTVAAAVAASSFHAAGPWQSATASPPAGSGPSSIEVRRCYVLDAAERLARCGGGAKLGVLNFASARNPGGGFTKGAEAQEESIARSSALYPCLTKHFDNFFVPHRKPGNPAYTHALIYSPGVPVIRASAGALLHNPYLADFVTAAAPNRKHMKGRDPAGDAEHTLRERARRVLSAFVQGGVADVVLGAWGCGVFENDPWIVANVFADHLRREFLGCFRSVVFAVPDEPHASVFEEVFGIGVQWVNTNPQPAPVSKFCADEKEFLKVARLVRDILKIEERITAGQRVEATQLKKIDKKDEAVAQLRSLELLLDPESDVREKCKDVIDRHVIKNVKLAADSQADGQQPSPEVAEVCENVLESKDFSSETRRLRKALREIEQLEQGIANGAHMHRNQALKIQKKEQYLHRLQELNQ